MGLAEQLRSPDRQREAADNISLAQSDRVRAELDKILASSGFRHAERMGRFLRYVVEHTLQDNGEHLKEYSIGADVFDRGSSFDPRVDPVVRVEARRLRKKLEEYYATEGAEDPLWIQLPKGGYVIALKERPALHAIQRESTTSVPLPVSGRRTALRFPRTAALWTGAAATVLVAIVSLGVIHNRNKVNSSLSPAVSAPVIQSLAVLPLQNLSGDLNKEYFVDGLTEALVTDLAQLHSLRVISRTSAMKYKGTSKPVPQIGQELHVDGVVEGSVVVSGNRVRITAQLIDARTDAHLWARTFEGNLEDVLALQGQVAQAIADGVRVRLMPQEQAQLSAIHVTVPEAQEAYLKGRYLLNQRTPGSSKKSLTYFQLAVRKDSHYALAHLALAEAYAVLASDDIAEPKGMVLKAKQAAQKALELEGGLGEAYATLAHLEFIYNWDFRNAEQQFRRATELSPNYATAHQWYGLLLMAERRFGEASHEFNAALQIDPLSLVSGIDLGQVYFYSGRYDRAIEQAREIIEISPDFAMAHDLLAMAYEQKGMYPQATAEFQKYSELSNDSLDARMHLAHVYAVSGKHNQARKMLHALEAAAKGGEFLSAYDIASVYVGLEEKERAFFWLNRALKERAAMLTFADIDPLLGPLRLDPRFQVLIRRIGLPEAR